MPPHPTSPKKRERAVRRRGHGERKNVILADNHAGNLHPTAQQIAPACPAYPRTDTNALPRHHTESSTDNQHRRRTHPYNTYSVHAACFEKKKKPPSTSHSEKYTCHAAQCILYTSIHIPVLSFVTYSTARVSGRGGFFRTSQGVFH